MVSGFFVFVATRECSGESNLIRWLGDLLVSSSVINPLTVIQIPVNQNWNPGNPSIHVFCILAQNRSLILHTFWLVTLFSYLPQDCACPTTDMQVLLLLFQLCYQKVQAIRTIHRLTHHPHGKAPTQANGVLTTPPGRTKTQNLEVKVRTAF